MAVSTFSSAFAWHILCKLMGGKGSFQASFRVISWFAPFAIASVFLGLLPYGFFIGMMYMLFLQVEASVGIHGIPRTRAWIIQGALFAYVMGSSVEKMVIGPLLKF